MSGTQVGAEIKEVAQDGDAISPEAFLLDRGEAQVLQRHRTQTLWGKAVS
jgi:hypothetical protein